MHNGSSRGLLRVIFTLSVIWDIFTIILFSPVITQLRDITAHGVLAPQ